MIAWQRRNRRSSPKMSCSNQPWLPTWMLSRESCPLLVPPPNSDRPSGLDTAVSPSRLSIVEFPSR